MALEIGVSAGFVTTAPTVDPTGTTNDPADGRSLSVKDTSPVGASKVVEIGWWNEGGGDTGTTEVGIYSHDSGNDKPGTLLGSASFTTASAPTWQKATVDISITAETTYWIALQCDALIITRFTNRETVTSERRSIAGGAGTELENPWPVGSTEAANQITSVYALTESAATGTNMQINIGDAWKEVPAVQINIGDVWKEVVGMQINIGDTWKTIF